MAEDPRIQYWLEADAGIRRANSLPTGTTQYWATLLTALVNATMACTPFDLMEDIIARKQATQQQVQRSIKKGLNRGR